MPGPLSPAQSTSLNGGPGISGSWLEPDVDGETQLPGLANDGSSPACLSKSLAAGEGSVATEMRPLGRGLPFVAPDALLTESEGQQHP